MSKKYVSMNVQNDGGTSIFDQEKYGRDDFENGKHNHVSDGTDRYAENASMVLGFKHVPSGNTGFFKAFITSFNESYSCDWSSEEVYGRTDPIMLFKSNKRQITLNFKVPAYSTGEAYENLGRVQRLTQFLYPSYKGISSAGSKTAHAQTIAQSPLIRLKVMNLLANQNGAPSAADEEKQQKNTSAAKMLANYFGNGKLTIDNTRGLLGAITSFQVNHNIENLEYGAIEHGQGTLLPKMIDVTVQFSPIHEHTIGWVDQEPINPHWPYGIQLKRPGSSPASPNSGPNATDDDLPDQARDNALSDAAQAAQDLAARRTSLGEAFTTLRGADGELMESMAEHLNASIDAYNADLASARNAYGSSALEEGGMRDTGAMRHYQ
mgnify:CR=1 FL=1